MNVKSKNAFRWIFLLFIYVLSANLYSSDFTCDEGKKYVSHTAGYVNYFCMKGMGEDEYVQHGPFVITDENGNTILNGFMQYGEPNGKWTAYYRNGLKRDEGHYSQGKKIGVWIYWNESGEVDRKEEYLKGKIQVQ